MAARPDPEVGFRRPGDHLRALECVVQTMRDDAVVESLRKADNNDDIWRLIGGGGTA